jgi:RNA polymerase sigma-70 factor (ECF subfamily)
VQDDGVRDDGVRDDGVRDDGVPGAQDADDRRFAAARPRLVGIAYRLLGTTADADDVVQEAWIRWRGTDRSVVRNHDAFLTTVVTRLALDRLRRRKREEDRYVGPWLPSPLVEPDPADTAELADSMTTAFLLMLERLTPDERAAFLLSDVFDEPFHVVADVMERSEEACRQLSSRARRKLRDEHRERARGGRAARDVVDRFLVAIASGDEAGALACVSADAVLVSDGGANRRAARRPVVGPDRIVRLVSNLWGRLPGTWRVDVALVGGVPGILVSDARDELYLAMGFEVRDGTIDRVFSVLNPDKLAGATTLGRSIV